jgi:hypothetical protein
MGMSRGDHIDAGVRWARSSDSPGFSSLPVVNTSWGRATLVELNLGMDDCPP